MRGLHHAAHRPVVTLPKRRKPEGRSRSGDRGVLPHTATKGFARSYRINLRLLPELAFSSEHDVRKETSSATTPTTNHLPKTSLKLPIFAFASWSFGGWENLQKLFLTQSLPISQQRKQNCLARTGEVKPLVRGGHSVITAEGSVPKRIPCHSTELRRPLDSIAAIPYSLAAMPSVFKLRILCVKNFHESQSGLTCIYSPDSLKLRTFTHDRKTCPCTTRQLANSPTPPTR